MTHWKNHSYCPLCTIFKFQANYLILNTKWNHFNFGEPDSCSSSSALGSKVVHLAIIELSQLFTYLLALQNAHEVLDNLKYFLFIYMKNDENNKAKKFTPMIIPFVDLKLNTDSNVNLSGYILASIIFVTWCICKNPTHSIPCAYLKRKPFKKKENGWIKQINWFKHLPLTYWFEFWQN